jgi:hypothetical protein
MTFTFWALQGLCHFLTHSLKTLTFFTLEHLEGEKYINIEATNQAERHDHDYTGPA